MNASELIAFLDSETSMTEAVLFFYLTTLPQQEEHI